MAGAQKMALAMRLHARAHKFYFASKDYYWLEIGSPPSMEPIAPHTP
jgi:hypothetical protein